MLIGRKSEQDILLSAVESDTSEFVADIVKAHRSIF